MSETDKMFLFRFKVSGVTFEGRQSLIEKLDIDDPVKLIPEPENPYDKNAIAVHIAHAGEIWHVGYMPKAEAAMYATILDGEALIGSIFDITGGFEKYDGSRASYGLIVSFSVPEKMVKRGSEPPLPPPDFIPDF